ncbi:MAG: beta-glucosidase BglX [Alistipes sp.]
MKKIRVHRLCLLFLLLGTTLRVVPAEASGKQTRDRDRFVAKLMQRMTLEEKVGQLCQCAGGGDLTGPNNERIPRTEPVVKGEIGSMLNILGLDSVRKYQQAAMQSRLQIPLIFGLDVIHGYRIGFPLPLAEAASFDLKMIEESARWAATEAAAEGCNWTFAPMVDVSWDARWGRVMEGAGEDPYYGARVAAARVHGFQGEDLAAENTIMACVKHFAGYGAPIAGKDYNSVDMSLGHFANFYMPPYKAAVEAGAATVMTAFNDLNNIPCTANEFLLRRLLKERWGFDGFVVSDMNAVSEMLAHRYAADGADAAAKALNAGLDMEMVTLNYHTHLSDLIRKGVVKEAVLDEAVRRILNKKYELGLFADPYRYCNEARAAATLRSAAMRDAARRMAERSMVLLENHNAALPLSPQVRRVALIGQLAKTQSDMLGSWSLWSDHEGVVTLYDALLKRGVEVNYSPGYDFDKNVIIDLEGAMAQAAKSDVVVVALGERSLESGERCSKADITIAAEQQKLVEELRKSGKPVIVLLMCGRPVIFNQVRHSASAILCTWWLGCEAGTALCNVLWGDYNPSAKLPMTFPAQIGQVPLYYQFKSTGRPQSPEGWTTSYIDTSYEPAYPFGYGLSYTRFAYSELAVSEGDGEGVHARVAVTVTNTGTRAGEEVVQLYVRDEVASITRPVKELRGFEKINLQAGESRRVSFDITDAQLGFYDNALNYVVEKGDFTLLVGTSSRDLQQVAFRLK